MCPWQNHFLCMCINCPHPYSPLLCEIVSKSVKWALICKCPRIWWLPYNYSLVISVPDPLYFGSTASAKECVSLSSHDCPWINPIQLTIRIRPWYVWVLWCKVNVAWSKENYTGGIEDLTNTNCVRYPPYDPGTGSTLRATLTKFITKPVAWLQWSMTTF